jgi:hypothetical protein
MCMQLWYTAFWQCRDLLGLGVGGQPVKFRHVVLEVSAAPRSAFNLVLARDQDIFQGAGLTG